MSDALRPARIDWSPGGPLARDFGHAPFWSEGGLAAATHLFLTHNRLPERFAALTMNAGFTLVETGFGSGLNWLATLDLWRRCASPGWLHYIGIEKSPFSRADLARAHAGWPALAALAAELQRHYPVLVPGFHRICLPEHRVTLTLCLGDVADLLPRLSARVDAWYLDGFAPQRNPDMWSEPVFHAMAAVSHEGSTFAASTAAECVRQGLVAAGFVAEVAAGFDGKGDMLHGHHVPPVPAASPARPWLSRPRLRVTRRQACVIGAGVAGAHTAHRLALRGWIVTVLEKDSVASAGSGNPAAVVYGRLAAPGKALDHFSQQAWLQALRELAQDREADSPWHPCGILQLATGNQAGLAHTLADQDFPSELVRGLTAAEASGIAGVKVEHACLHYPGGGWLEAARYCRRLLDHPNITLREATEVKGLQQVGAGWRLLDARDDCLLETPVLVLANAGAATDFPELADLPLSSIRGQVSLAPPSPASAALRTLICHDGYLSPALPDEGHCLGATFQPGSTDMALRREDHAENRDLLAEAMPGLAASLAPETEWRGRVALRCQSPDYLPLVGPVADRQQFLDRYAGLRDGKVKAYPPLPVLPGLYVNIAHGSKGFSHAMLAAEILASELNGEPAPVSTAVLDALHPMRFRVRELRRSGKPARP